MTLPDRTEKEKEPVDIKTNNTYVNVGFCKVTFQVKFESQTQIIKDVFNINEETSFYICLLQLSFLPMGKKNILKSTDFSCGSEAVKGTKGKYGS